MDPEDPLQLPTGTAVTITPDDYAKDPVTGEVAATTPQSISIRRHDAQVGDVVVHFPKIGYDVTRA